ncbi:hypothetical protein EAF04_007559 [Stromatinia cepivora]|nr:hypothetical protein EAF04_007559 [Stromatinia cepivora]
MSTKDVDVYGRNYQMSNDGLPPFRSYSENVDLRLRPRRHVRGEWNKEQLEFMERLRRENEERGRYGDGKAGEGGKDGEEKGDEGKVNKVKEWINWKRWGLSIGFVLFNLLFALPLAYLIAKFTVPSPWQWITFILSHHVMLAIGYEIAMDIRDRMIKEEEEKIELEKWDEVVGELEGLLRDCRAGRLVLGSVEEGLMGKKKENNSELAQKEVNSKLKQMEDARLRGLMIDRELWVVLKRKQLDFDKVAHH